MSTQNPEEIEDAEVVEEAAAPEQAAPAPQEQEQPEPAPRTELAKVIEPTEGMAEKIYWAKTLAASDMLPKHFRGRPANLLYAVEYAQALELPRITVLTDMHVIEGKPSASANLISTLVRRAGHRLRVYGSLEEGMTAEIVRVDDPDFTFRATWTMADAQRAQVTHKDNWKHYPKAMLKARAITEVAREACSEVLHGVVYTPEELGEVVDEQGQLVEAPAPQQPQTPMPRQAGSVRRQRAFEPRPLTVVPPAPAEPAPAPQRAPEPRAAAVVQHPSAPAPAGDSQLAHVKAALMGAGYHTAAAKSDRLSALTGRDIALPRDLTADEADAAINELLREAQVKAHAATIPTPAAGVQNFTNEDNEA
jgi:hypothetical protein